MNQEKILSLIGLAILAALLILAFRAYLSPTMLIEFANTVLCS